MSFTHSLQSHTSSIGAPPPNSNIIPIKKKPHHAPYLHPLSSSDQQRKYTILTTTYIFQPEANRSLPPLEIDLGSLLGFITPFLMKVGILRDWPNIVGSAATSIVTGCQYSDVDICFYLKKGSVQNELDYVRDVLRQFIKQFIGVKSNYFIDSNYLCRRFKSDNFSWFNLGQIDVKFVVGDDHRLSIAATDGFHVMVSEGIETACCVDGFIWCDEQEFKTAVENVKCRRLIVDNLKDLRDISWRLNHRKTQGYSVKTEEGFSSDKISFMALEDVKRSYPLNIAEKTKAFQTKFQTHQNNHYPKSSVGKMVDVLNLLSFLERGITDVNDFPYLRLLAQSWMAKKVPNPQTNKVPLLDPLMLLINMHPSLTRDLLSVVKGFFFLHWTKDAAKIPAYSFPFSENPNTPRAQICLKDNEQFEYFLALEDSPVDVAIKFVKAWASLEQKFENQREQLIFHKLGESLGLEIPDLTKQLRLQIIKVLSKAFTKAPITTTLSIQYKNAPHENSERFFTFLQNEMSGDLDDLENLKLKSSLDTISRDLNNPVISSSLAEIKKVLPNIKNISIECLKTLITQFISLEKANLFQILLTHPSFQGIKTIITNTFKEIRYLKICTPDLFVEASKLLALASRNNILKNEDLYGAAEMILSNWQFTHFLDQSDYATATRELIIKAKEWSLRSEIYSQRYKLWEKNFNNFIIDLSRSLQNENPLKVKNLIKVFDLLCLVQVDSKIIFSVSSVLIQHVLKQTKMGVNELYISVSAYYLLIKNSSDQSFTMLCFDLGKKLVEEFNNPHGDLGRQILTEIGIRKENEFLRPQIQPLLISTQTITEDSLKHFSNKFPVANHLLELSKDQHLFNDPLKGVQKAVHIMQKVRTDDDFFVIITNPLISTCFHNFITLILENLNKNTSFSINQNLANYKLLEQIASWHIPNKFHSLFNQIQNRICDQIFLELEKMLKIGLNEPIFDSCFRIVFNNRTNHSQKFLEFFSQFIHYAISSKQGGLLLQASEKAVEILKEGSLSDDAILVDLSKELLYESFRTQAYPELSQVYLEKALALLKQLDSITKSVEIQKEIHLLFSRFMSKYFSGNVLHSDFTICLEAFVNLKSLQAQNKAMEVQPSREQKIKFFLSILENINFNLLLIILKKPSLKNILDAVEYDQIDTRVKNRQVSIEANRFLKLLPNFNNVTALYLQQEMLSHNSITNLVHLLSEYLESNNPNAQPICDLLSDFQITISNEDLSLKFDEAIFEIITRLTQQKTSDALLIAQELVKHSLSCSLLQQNSSKAIEMIFKTTKEISDTDGFADLLIESHHFLKVIPIPETLLKDMSTFITDQAIHISRKLIPNGSDEMTIARCLHIALKGNLSTDQKKMIGSIFNDFVQSACSSKKGFSIRLASEIALQSLKKKLLLSNDKLIILLNTLLYLPSVQLEKNQNASLYQQLGFTLIETLLNSDVGNKKEFQKILFDATQSILFGSFKLSIKLAAYNRLLEVLSKNHPIKEYALPADAKFHTIMQTFFEVLFAVDKDYAIQFSNHPNLREKLNPSDYIYSQIQVLNYYLKLADKDWKEIMSLWEKVTSLSLLPDPIWTHQIKVSLNLLNIIADTNLQTMQHNLIVVSTTLANMFETCSAQTQSEAIQNDLLNTVRAMLNVTIEFSPAPRLATRLYFAAKNKGFVSDSCDNLFLEQVLGDSHFSAITSDVIEYSKTQFNTILSEQERTNLFKLNCKLAIKCFLTKDINLQKQGLDIFLKLLTFMGENFRTQESEDMIIGLFQIVPHTPDSEFDNKMCQIFEKIEAMFLFENQTNLNLQKIFNAISQSVVIWKNIGITKFVLHSFLNSVLFCDILLLCMKKASESSDEDFFNLIDNNIIQLNLIQSEKMTTPYQVLSYYYLFTHVNNICKKEDTQSQLFYANYLLNQLENIPTDKTQQDQLYQLFFNICIKTRSIEGLKIICTSYKKCLFAPLTTLNEFIRAYTIIIDKDTDLSFSREVFPICLDLFRTLLLSNMTSESDRKYINTINLLLDTNVPILTEFALTLLELYCQFRYSSEGPKIIPVHELFPTFKRVQKIQITNSITNEHFDEVTKKYFHPLIEKSTEVELSLIRDKIKRVKDGPTAKQELNSLAALLEKDKYPQKYFPIIQEIIIETGKMAAKFDNSDLDLVTDFDPFMTPAFYFTSVGGYNSRTNYFFANHYHTVLLAQSSKEYSKIFAFNQYNGAFKLVDLTSSLQVQVLLETNLTVFDRFFREDLSLNVDTNLKILGPYLEKLFNIKIMDEEIALSLTRFAATLFLRLVTYLGTAEAIYELIPGIKEKKLECVDKLLKNPNQMAEFEKPIIGKFQDKMDLEEPKTQAILRLIHSLKGKKLPQSFKLYSEAKILKILTTYLDIILKSNAYSFEKEKFLTLSTSQVSFAKKGCNILSAMLEIERFANRYFAKTPFLVKLKEYLAKNAPELLKAWNDIQGNSKVVVATETKKKKSRRK